MNRLVLIDTQNFFHRAFYAYPKSFTTPASEPIGAVYGFTSMLFALVMELSPTHLACADESEKELVFRAVEYPDYKATRIPKPPEEQALYDVQIPKLAEFLGTAHIPRLTAEGYEADDVIGTIVKQVIRESGNQVTRGKDIHPIIQLPSYPVTEIIITSNDRDLMQLIGGRVRFYLPNVGKNGGKIYGEKEFFEEYGFKPSQIIEYKALRGDPSDNIAGVKGIGEKTGLELVRKYGTLEETYRHLLDLKSAVAQKLNDGKDGAFLSRKLVTLATDAPIKFELEDLRFPGLGQPEVFALFERWGFNSLLAKLNRPEENQRQTALPI